MALTFESPKSPHDAAATSASTASAAVGPGAKRQFETATLLPPNQTSPAAARAFTREMLALWHVTAACDNTELIVSELVTNAVLHAEQPIMVSLAVQGEVVQVEVLDDSAAIARTESAAGERTGGYGLALVAALASEWGTRPEAAGGKTVWAKVVVRELLRR